jgi:hypothetical protein
MRRSSLPGSKQRESNTGRYCRGTAILTEAGIPFEDESGSWRKVWLHSPRSLDEHESHSNLGSLGSLDWEIRSADVRGAYVSNLFCSTQVGTVGTFRSLSDATRWLVTMLGRYGIPASRFVRAEIDARLKSAAAALRGAGFAVMPDEADGSGPMVWLYVRVIDERLNLSFSIFPEPSGGYYVAEPGPGDNARECVCERPEDVVAWIASFAESPIQRDARSRAHPFFPAGPEEPGLEGRKHRRPSHRSRRRE